MSLKGIIFTTENVKAVLEGRKTRTSRIIKPQPVCHGRSLAQQCIGSKLFSYDAVADALYCGECGNIVEYSPEGKNYVKQIKPRYKIGDILCVKETYAALYYGKNKDGKPIDEYFYKAGFEDGWQDCDLCDIRDTDCKGEGNTKCFVPCRKWKSPLFMPKEAARIFLRVTDIKAERINDITDEDAIAEGIFNIYGYGYSGFNKAGWVYVDPKETKYPNSTTGVRPRQAFMWLWMKIHGQGAWALNDWVWAYKFERCEKPHDDGQSA